MIDSPMPTRAEVSDVAAAIYEGADAIMLSAESAAGAYPVQAVTTMDNVAAEVERDPTYLQIMAASRSAKRATVADGVVSAAREIAEATNVLAICCFSESGTTALLTARERPQVPIIAMTTVPLTARALCLTWGVYPVMTGDLDRFKTAVVYAVRASRTILGARAEDNIIVVAGVPFNTPGSTNILRVAPCEEKLIFRQEPG